MRVGNTNRCHSFHTCHTLKNVFLRQIAKIISSSLIKKNLGGGNARRKVYTRNTCSEHKDSLKIIKTQL